MKNIAIIGAGGFGKEVKMLIDHINVESNEYNFIGYYDDGIRPLTMVNGFPVLGSIKDLNLTKEKIWVVAAIGLPSLKKRLLSKLDNPLIVYPTLVHPAAIVGSDDVSIGEGSIVCAGTFITVNIQIGKHVVLNLGCTVGHDSVIQDYCSFMPSVNISGEVDISDCVYVGTGAKIINQLEIGSGTIIGAGAVVSKSLPANCTAVGIPAKPIKYHEAI